MRSGSSGVGARSPRGRRSRRAARARRAPSPSVCSEPQPCSPASTIVYTPSISEPVTSTAPSTSAPRAQPDALLVRRAAAAASTPVAMPIGTLTKKIQCQLIAWVSTPPASRPIEAPAERDEAVDADRLRLLARLGEHRHDHAEDHGRGHRAADALEEARARSASPGCRRRPHSSDAAVKSVEPGEEDARAADQVAEAARRAAAGRRRRSGRRSRPTRGSDWEKPRSSWIDGSATFTIVPSRMIISIPAQSTTRASQRERSGGEVVTSGMDADRIRSSTTELSRDGTDFRRRRRCACARTGCAHSTGVPSRPLTSCCSAATNAARCSRGSAGEHLGLDLRDDPLALGDDLRGRRR